MASSQEPVAAGPETTENIIRPGELRAADIHTRRAMMEEWIKAGVEALGPLSESLEEFWIDIPTHDGWKSHSLVVRPKSAVSDGKEHPLIVHWFGGGFGLGSPGQMTRPAREFAETFGAVVVLPNYRLYPDHRWPTPMRDGWDVLVWLSKNAEKELGATLSGPGGAFVIGGASAGATLAAAMATVSSSNSTEFEVEKLPKALTGTFLAIPLTLTEEIVPAKYKNRWTSREDNKNAEGLNSEGVNGVIKELQANAKSAWFSPFGVEPENLKSFPPTYVQACEFDPLRDDGILLEKLLAEQGVKTRINVFPDDAHAAMAALPFETKSKNPTIAEATMRGMEWLLGQA